MGSKSIFAVLTSCVVISAGCGVDADDLSGRKLKDPQLPKDTQSFYLSEGEYDKTFTGSVIGWQDDADVDGVAGVAKVSNDLIDNGVASLAYIRDVVAPLKAEFDGLYKQVEANNIAYHTKSYQIAVHAAATWFAGADGTGGQMRAITEEYAALTGEPLPQEAYAQANTWMVAYCEAKLWERATAKNLIYEEYRGRRPTPSAMCEGVYQKLGLISTDAPLCAASEEYKNYFGCLWHEGMKKTTLWQTRYPAGSDANDKFSKTSDEVLMYNFAEENLSRDLLQQRRAGELIDPETGRETEVDLKFVAGPTGPASLSVQKILRNIEFRPNDGDAYQIIPVGDAEGEVKTLLEAKNDWLRDHVTFFNKLSLGGYINENRFNRIFQKDSQTKGDIKWSETQQAEAAQKFPEVFLVSNEELDKIQQDLAAVQADILANGKKALRALGPVMPRSDCPKLPKDYDPKLMLGGSFKCMYNRLSKAAIETVMPATVSQAVWQGQIRIRRDTEQRTLEVWVTPNKIGGQTHYGCTELTSGDKTYCPQDGGKGFGKAGIEIDETTGYFNIWAVIDDPEKSAMAAMPREKLEKQLSFSEVEERKIRHNHLSFYVTLNTIDDVLTTLLGDAAIKTPEGEVLVPASIKMRDETPHFQMLAHEYEKSLKALQRRQ